MKKLFVVILSVLLSGTIFTSFSPSLDGRAVVAPEGAMPKGVFAKTVGYLPGDSISVTSLSAKKTVDILVIGSIDSSEGVAILLSPEAAELLGLSKDANNVVKITKRSGQLDEAVAGTAVIGGKVENDESDFEPEEIVSESENTAGTEEDSDSIEEISAEKAEGEEKDDYAEETVEPEPVETVEAAENPAPETEIEPEVIDEAVPHDSEDLENSGAESSEEAVPSEPLESAEEIPEEKVPSKEDSVEPEKIDATDVPEEDELSENSGEIPVPVEECPEEVEPDEKLEPAEGDELSESVEKIEATDEPAAEEPEPEKESVSVDDDVVSETPFEEESVSADELPEMNVENSEPVENERPEAVPYVDSENVEAGPLSEENSEESYEPIVLVPAESNPPESAGKPAEIYKNEVSAKPAENKAEESASEGKKPGASKKSLEKYKVSSLKELESGKYYIQIAVLADENNLKNTVSKFEKQYPVTLVPLASGKATQVMIGPLGMDEYGAVLNRFKKSGYKDAFLRKIK